MNEITLPKKEYKGLVRRQIRIEEKLEVLQKLIREDLVEDNISPAALKRWEKISNEVDKGRGRTFTSVRGMRNWVKKL